MNCTFCITTDLELSSRSAYTDVPAVEDSYATAPVAIVRPEYSPINEEELHTAFEEAISDRLPLLRERLSRLSYTSSGARYITAPLALGAPAEKMPGIRSWLPENRWQRGIILSALAINLTLIGFDLMGLLVLALR